jgi:cell division protein FtsQ
VSTPRDGGRRTQREGTGTPREPGAPRERSAAAERAMRRRSRREQHMSGTDRPRRSSSDRSTAERPARERPTRDRSGAERPAGVAADRARRQRRSAVLTRRRVLIRRSVAVSVLVGLVAVVAAVLWTPLLGVRTVQVSGAQELTAAQVISAAQVPTGTPMVRLDVSAIKYRVHQLPRVGRVDVVREWPSTIRIDITERDPVGYVVEADGNHLVDRTGLDYATIVAKPPGLPRIVLTKITPSDQRTVAVVAVLGALPTQLRSLVLTVGAKTPGSVTLGLTGGRTIRWGSMDDSARKAQVLAALMTRPGKVYDVSSPDLPTVS